MGYPQGRATFPDFPKLRFVEACERRRGKEKNADSGVWAVLLTIVLAGGGRIETSPKGQAKT